MENKESTITEAQKRARDKYNKKAKRESLAFYPPEMEMWKHLNSQPNKQGYIKSLIKADMQKNKQ